MSANSQLPFVHAPGQSRYEIRNPERMVGRWIMGCAVLAGVLMLLGII